MTIRESIRAKIRYGRNLSNAELIGHFCRLEREDNANRCGFALFTTAWNRRFIRHEARRRGIDLQAACIELKLVLTFHWFEETESGRKRIEYRSMTDRWGKQIWGAREFITAVRFSRGYTSRTITRPVTKIDVGPCPIPGWSGQYYRIHFLPNDRLVLLRNDLTNTNHDSNKR